MSGYDVPLYSFPSDAYDALAPFVKSFSLPPPEALAGSKKPSLAINWSVSAIHKSSSEPVI